MHSAYIACKVEVQHKLIPLGGITAFQRLCPLPHLGIFFLPFCYPRLSRTAELHRNDVVCFKLAVGVRYNVFSLKYYLLLIICINFNYFKIF